MQECICSIFPRRDSRLSLSHSLSLLGPQSHSGDNWGQITWNLSALSPKRDWSSKEVKAVSRLEKGKLNTLIKISPWRCGRLLGWGTVPFVSELQRKENRAAPAQAALVPTCCTTTYCRLASPSRRCSASRPLLSPRTAVRMIPFNCRRVLAF